MDEQTRSYYKDFANRIAEQYERARPEMTGFLHRAFSEGMRILDIGAGSGRDMDLLFEMECDVYGVEPGDELRSVALQNHPKLAGRLQPGELPMLGQPFGGDFDGVLCSGVLMHLPRAAILDAAIAMRNVLKENGRLLLSIPLERAGLNKDYRDEHGRLFTPLPPDYLQLLFERIGFHLIDRWDSADSLNREGYSWRNFLFQARHLGGTRPLDQIEGILNRDRKTATYKLALFRALSEIATTEFEQAHWVSDGVVGIPIAIVCEKWLYYYWPILESARFIPQIRGETPICQQPVAFRASLSQLIQHYQGLGGLTSFVLDYRKGKLLENAKRQLERVLRQLQNTVVRGPVTYAGGALESGRPFSYDAPTREVRMNAALWRELSLVGHWIQDAVILRWAELTSEISRKEIRPSEVIDLLLTVAIPERDVADARRTYADSRAPECTWSGVSLSKGFDVDHIIPYSLWHNNDLWNLVPASSPANNLKRDKLPTRELMHRRRERILGCWEMLRSAHRSRFDYEVCRIAGVSLLPNDWQSLAFRSVTDAVEFTATQRGCERWQP
ncbi:MAG: methyltransferase domain-containing protein [Dehalococcoidia bacterium]|nr:methyltransferase domain-containing protein [Dehalococcoidia bacterium]